MDRGLDANGAQGRIEDHQPQGQSEEIDRDRYDQGQDSHQQTRAPIMILAYVDESNQYNDQGDSYSRADALCADDDGVGGVRADGANVRHGKGDGGHGR